MHTSGPVDRLNLSNTLAVYLSTVYLRELFSGANINFFFSVCGALFKSSKPVVKREMKKLHYHPFSEPEPVPVTACMLT